MNGKRVRRVSSQQKQVIAQAIYARMRPQLARLPHLIEQLGDGDPAPFFARKLLTPPLVDELVDVLGPLLSEPLESKRPNSPLFQGHLGDLPLLSLLGMLSAEERSGILALTLNVAAFYGEAMRLTNMAKRLDEFEYRARRLRRQYADVFAAREASPHVDLVRTLLRDTRAALRQK